MVRRILICRANSSYPFGIIIGIRTHYHCLHTARRDGIRNTLLNAYGEAPAGKTLAIHGKLARAMAAGKRRKRSVGASIGPLWWDCPKVQCSLVLESIVVRALTCPGLDNIPALSLVKLQRCAPGLLMLTRKPLHSLPEGAVHRHRRHVPFCSSAVPVRSFGRAPLKAGSRGAQDDRSRHSFCVAACKWRLHLRAVVKYHSTTSWERAIRARPRDGRTACTSRAAAFPPFPATIVVGFIGAPSSLLPETRVQFALQLQYLDRQLSLPPQRRKPSIGTEL